VIGKDMERELLSADVELMFNGAERHQLP
jgi:hypothetical protein